MMKKFMLIVAAGLVLVACNKENKQNSDYTEDTTAVETVVAPEAAEPVVMQFASEDGTRHFEFAAIDETGETADIKDIEENKVYNMKRVESASGAKYEDAEGNFFWEKGEEFSFGKGDEILCSGKQVIAPAEEAAPAE